MSLCFCFGKKFPTVHVSRLFIPVSAPEDSPYEQPNPDPAPDVREKPMGFFDYNHLQMNSYCTLSDSGTITEESDILNFPAITIRTSHERPEGMDAGTLIMSGVSKENVFRSINYVCKNFKNFQRDKVQDYLTVNASDKLIKVILSYTDLVNKRIWFKE